MLNLHNLTETMKFQEFAKQFTQTDIMSFLFPDDIKHIIKFIRFIKKNDRLNINTIAYDNCVFRQIYPNKSKNLTNDDKNILKSLK